MLDVFLHDENVQRWKKNAKSLMLTLAKFWHGMTQAIKFCLTKIKVFVLEIRKFNVDNAYSNEKQSA